MSNVIPINARKEHMHCPDCQHDFRAITWPGVVQSKCPACGAVLPTSYFRKPELPAGLMNSLARLYKHFRNYEQHR